MSSICCICLIDIVGIGCYKLNHSDETGISWLNKLYSIVPELEQISSKFVEDSLVVCDCCINQIDGIIRFKNHLIELIAKHNLQTTRESITGFENDDIFNNSIEYQKLSDHTLQDVSETTCSNACLEYNFPCDSRIGSPENQETGSLATISTETIQNYLEKECNDEINFKESESQCKKSSESITHGKLSKINEKGNKSSLVCNSCNAFLTTKGKLKLHQKSCAKFLGRVQDRHEIERKATNKYSCEKCDLKFDYIKDVIAHSTIVHSMNEKAVKPYSCDICSCRFTCFSNYSQHKKYHNGTRDHICSLCGKTFITKGDLMAHDYIHQNRRNYKCTICEKAFNTNKNLRTHNLVVHTDHTLWKHECSICHKRFPLKGNFDQHMKRHSGDKQYVCHICEKSFVSRSELKRHVSLHTNIRAFSCEYCNQEYKTLRTLNIHLKRSHSIGDVKLPLKERKYVCHICPSQFYNKHKLTRHLYGHSGLKPFSCDSCDKKFTDKSYLSHHLQVSHNIMKSTID
ncbi:unnamed protein product [Phaedon cochleariae]|uniref:C2H2-type domain-containing protein n=1 Tax=Phaedon cochleariae TaxID=80249 RepID=A0A9P0GPA2_PHACE|nr:unnamed protein product [Phaedon cochleariae]